MRILLDVDGPIADFVGAAVRVVNDLGGGNFTPADVTDWEVADLLAPELRQTFWDRVTAEGFCSSLDIVPDAREHVAQLLATHDTYFVTSDMASSKTWAWERREWLKRHFDVHYSRIIHAHAKHLVRGDVLVDDKPKHIDRWQGSFPNGLPLLWAMPHNESAKPKRAARVQSWSQVVDIIETVSP